MMEGSQEARRNFLMAWVVVTGSDGMTYTLMMLNNVLRTTVGEGEANVKRALLSTCMLKLLDDKGDIYSVQQV